MILPRILDKGRATIAGKNGAYQFNCPLDRRFLEFAGVSANSLMNQLATGKPDGLILGWIRKNASPLRTPWEIAAWREYEEGRAPMELEARKFFNSIHLEMAPERDDIMTWFDLLDLDDYVSFGALP